MYTIFDVSGNRCEQTVSNENDEHGSIDGFHTASPFSSSSSFTNDDVSSDNTEDFSNIDSDLSSTIAPLSIQQQDRSIRSSHRMSFSLDVNPSQRDIYKSDEFNIRSGKPNGRITRIQGVKTEKQKMCQVLPRLRIPAECLCHDVNLFVVAVYEELSNGKRVWYKNPNKGFLPDSYSKETEPINPIEVDLKKCKLADNGDFILSLQMITKWNKSTTDSTKIYELDEEQAIQIHPAEHDSKGTRLLCVLQINGCYEWSTFCLSSFIRSPKSQKQRSASPVTGDSNSPKQKRPKIDTNMNKSEEDLK